MESHCLLEHTADMGIEATAATIEGLFVQAALGLKEMVFGEETFDERAERRITLEEDDLDELLVRWLSEILYLIETKHLAPSRFIVDPIIDHRLNALVVGECLPHGQFQFERAVKAITYHRLEVIRRHGSWIARVYVDL